MPQTREHLDICRLLGVRKGIVVLTKADLVDPEWLEMVRTAAGVGQTAGLKISAPADARPAARAQTSIGPDRRVSAPTIHRSPPSTAAAARPSPTASSGARRSGCTRPRSS